jgi:hypothetical protein
MVVSLSALRVLRPLPRGRFLVLISVSSWVQTRAIMRLEGLGQLKNPNDLIENGTMLIPLAARSRCILSSTENWACGFEYFSGHGSMSTFPLVFALCCVRRRPQRALPLPTESYHMSACQQREAFPPFLPCPTRSDSCRICESDSRDVTASLETFRFSLILVCMSTGSGMSFVETIPPASYPVTYFPYLRKVIYWDETALLSICGIWGWIVSKYGMQFF